MSEAEAEVSIVRLVRQARQGRLHPSKLGRPRIAGRDLRRPADHRHLQHVVGADAVQRALPRARRAREARRVGSRRRAVRVPGDVARRDQPAADGDAVPQPRERWTSRNRSARNPIDGVVLLCGCDKTTPALVMGAASCDLPALVVSGGPMLNGKFRGADIGSGTDVWRFSEEVKAGAMSLQGIHAGRVLHVALDRARATSWARRPRWRRWPRRSG